MKSSIKRTLLWVTLGIFTFLFIVPLQAQEVRDHRNKKKDNKVRDHRTETNTTVRNHRENKNALTIPFFEEADAFFGTRTQILEKYPSLKSTGRVDRIMITDKLHDGDNSIYKMESGNTLHAIVKKGKIIEYTWKDSRGNQIIGGNGNDILTGGSGSDNVVAIDDDPTRCYRCTEICFDDGFGRHPDGGPPCWTTCVPVDCSDSTRNHTLPGPIVEEAKQ